MVPYLVLLFAAGLLGFFLCERKPSRKKDFWLLLGATVVMVAMAAMRSAKVGVDTQPYLDYFKLVSEQDLAFLFSSSNTYQKEIGYSLLNYAVSIFTDNSFVLMGVVSGLIIVLRSIAIWRQSSKIWMSVFLYISFGFFGYSMCTLRQELAISIVLFALPFLQKRKPLPYMLITILAATFHSSLWIMIPVYFVANLPLDWRMLSVYVVGMLTVLLFSEPLIEWFIRLVPRFAGYAPGTYYMMGRDFNTILMPILFFLIAFLMQKRLLARSPENRVLINLACYSALLFALTIKHFVFQRVALIFLPVMLFLIPEMLVSLKPAQEDYAALNQPIDKNKKKQMLKKYGELKNQYDGEITLYYTATGLILAACILYYLFLLYANRLLLVPYLVRF